MYLPYYFHLKENAIRYFKETFKDESYICLYKVSQRKYFICKRGFYMPDDNHMMIAKIVNGEFINIDSK